VTQQEYQTLIGFFMRNFGGLNSFVIMDPEDQSVAAHPFGRGDGTTKDFQLQRTLVADSDLAAPGSRSFWPAYVDGYEPVWEPAWPVSVYVNSVLTTAYTQGTTGALTFNAAPASGSVLTWTGTFGRRVRFADSTLTVDRIVPALWKSEGIELIEVKP
jgi:hypothetical protein